ncbi:Flp pilus assembly complex ATPase component TadA [Aquincola tertiaricarbonis]|uniref:Flp pilus assembly complex ATPase component TadA n=1 Tax=Aquincola tertiaricarbonis TaxID=391953 RepID=A0ABY4SD71_AQUTE|nr:type II/IV secretion system protein [Aquincola tertiaricarbonis]URI11273.1 Flp pilus assembly complex ATPase component TadA [Aquincola tertiaricarbonis]
MPPAAPASPSSGAAARPSSSVPPGDLPAGRLEWRALLQWLVADGWITLDDADRVERRFGAGDSRQHPLVRLGGAGLVRKGNGKPLDTEALTEWLAGHLGLPYVRIDPLKVDVGRVADVMSIHYAESRRVLPLNVSLVEVTVATSEPLDTAWVAEIEGHARKKIRLVLANPVDVQRYTTEFFTLARSVKAAAKSGETSAIASFEQLVELGKANKQLDANDQGVVQVVDWLWQYAFDQRASDIHLEPRRDMGAIRFRIDGVLHTVYQLPVQVMSAMTARIKLLGRMDVVERRRPQDGRIKTVRPEVGGQPGGEVEMRLSTLPTAFGEKMVMRIFDPDTVVKSIEALGFGAHDAQRWQELTGRSHGIILVTGPTGSGKTTTLYSTLKKLATDEVNVCTVEDPIEMVEPALNQTQVQPALDLGFAEGLRALMRQDPDIIMVGEIRDLATAEMAIQAALTGHLVFSTLHTNDAASAITRLADLGVPPYLISATVIGVLAQRLARTLCPACKVRDEDVSREMLDAAAQPWRLKGAVRAYRPVGCLECRMTGFRGRAGLYELMVMSDAARAAVHPVLDAAALRRQALADGMHPLRLAGVMKVADGSTTIEEVLRTTPKWSETG